MRPIHNCELLRALKQLPTQSQFTCHNPPLIACRLRLAASNEAGSFYIPTYRFYAAIVIESIRDFLYAAPSAAFRGFALWQPTNSF